MVLVITSALLKLGSDKQVLAVLCQKNFNLKVFICFPLKLGQAVEIEAMLSEENFSSSASKIEI